MTKRALKPRPRLGSRKSRRLEGPLVSKLQLDLLTASLAFLDPLDVLAAATACVQLLRAAASRRIWRWGTLKRLAPAFPQFLVRVVSATGVPFDEVNFFGPRRLPQLRYVRFSNKKCKIPKSVPVSITHVRLSSSYPLKHLPGLCNRLVKLKIVGPSMPNFEDILLPRQVPQLRMLTIHASFSFRLPCYPGLKSLKLLGWANPGLSYGSIAQQPALESLEIDGHHVVNEAIRPGDLPPTLKSLALNSHSCELQPDALPPGLVSLKLFDCTKVLPPLPATLRTLELRWYNHPLLPGRLPSQLKTLNLRNFNQPLVPGSLPCGLQRVIFHWFDQRLLSGVLPPGLKTLNLGCKFNHNIPRGVLPSGLETLYLGQAFDQPLARGVLPAGLKRLDMIGVSKQVVLSNGLKFLQLGNNTRQPIQVPLPRNLEHLHLERGYQHELDYSLLPQGPLCIHVFCDYQHRTRKLPPGIEWDVTHTLQCCDIRCDTRTAVL